VLDQAEHFNDQETSSIAVLWSLPVTFGVRLSHISGEFLGILFVVTGFEAETLVITRHLLQILLQGCLAPAK
jgi:hypothetical protein